MCVISKPKPIYVPQPVQSRQTPAPPPAPETPQVTAAGQRERARLNAMRSQQSTIVTSGSGLMTPVNTAGRVALGG